MTRAPRAASSSANARPIPVEPPVIIADFPGPQSSTSSFSRPSAQNYLDREPGYAPVRARAFAALRRWLDDAHLLRFVALLAGCDRELDVVAFVERLVALTGDGGEVDEHVGATFSSDEAVSLFGVEKLHSASGHCDSLRDVEFRGRSTARWRGYLDAVANARWGRHLGRRLLENVHAAGRTQPDHVGEAQLRPLDLAVAALVTQVLADLPDVGDSRRRDRMALRLQSTRHVHRRAAVAPRRTRLEEVDCATGLAQHQVVVVHQLCGGETVVQLDEIEIVRSDARPLVSLLRRIARQRIDVGEDLARLFPGIGGEDRRRHLDGPALLLT